MLKQKILRGAKSLGSNENLCHATYRYIGGHCLSLTGILVDTVCHLPVYWWTRSVTYRYIGGHCLSLAQNLLCFRSDDQK